MRGSWSRPLAALSPRASASLWVASFVMPVALWCAVSYFPFLWHSMVRVRDPGDVTWFTPGQLVERAAFDSENAAVQAQHGRLA
ncbi:MAG TPA: ABC transporter permease, partial [Polyangia bacterium]|nr:ABC transporter permease [Polyangia bacterium]